MKNSEIIKAYDDLKEAHLELLALSREEKDLALKKQALQKKVSLLRDEIRNISIW